MSAARWAAQEKEWSEKIEAMAVAREIIEREEQQGRFAIFAADHEKDAATFEFDCRRHGDFLSVFVTRSDVRGDDPIKFSTAINIGKTKTIQMMAGHGPDNTDTMRYRLSAIAIDGSGSAWWTGMGRGPPAKGQEYIVRGDVKGLPYGRLVFAIDQEPDGHSYIGMNEYRVRHQTKDYARAAEDDRIRFEGVKATIYTPAGLGQSVHDKIMAELERKP